jgi:hypothetical protein
MSEKLKKIFCWVGCVSGLWHLRCVRSDEGITCIDCSMFKTKAEHQADLHAGGGW